MKARVFFPPAKTLSRASLKQGTYQWILFIIEAYFIIVNGMLLNKARETVVIFLK